MKKFWRWVVVLVAQQCEYTSCVLTVHLKRDQDGKLYAMCTVDPSYPWVPPFEEWKFSEQVFQKVTKIKTWIFHASATIHITFTLCLLLISNLERIYRYRRMCGGYTRIRRHFKWGTWAPSDFGVWGGSGTSPQDSAGSCTLVWLNGSSRGMMGSSFDTCGGQLACLRPSYCWFKVPLLFYTFVVMYARVFHKL